MSGSQYDPGSNLPTCIYLPDGTGGGICDAQFCNADTTYARALLTPAERTPTQSQVQNQCLENWNSGERGVFDVGTTCSENLLAIIGCETSQCAQQLEEHSARGELCAALSESECEDNPPAPCGTRSTRILWVPMQLAGLGVSKTVCA